MKKSPSRFHAIIEEKKHRNRTTTQAQRLAARPQSFPLFRITSGKRRPTPHEFDAALAVCEILMSKCSTTTASNVWSLLASLNLPASQESWVRALFLDVARGAPIEKNPHRRGQAYLSYLTLVRNELRQWKRDIYERQIAAPPSVFDVLDSLFS